MALRFQPPAFVQPDTYSDIAEIPRSLDALMQAYAAAKRRKLEERGLRGEQALKRLELGFDPAGIGPSEEATLRGPVAEVESPVIAAARAYLGRRQKTRGLEEQKTEAEIRKTKGEAAKAEAAATAPPGSLPGAEVNRILEVDLFPPDALVSPAQQSLAKARFAQEKKPPTATESVAAGYAVRAREAHDIINRAQGLDFDPTAAASYVSGSEAFPNILKSEPRQVFEQAQRNFINAVLRRESGAVISPDEFSNARQQYFPQPGDGPDVIANKARNRQVVIETLSVEGKRALERRPTTPTAPLPADGGKKSSLPMTPEQRRARIAELRTKLGGAR